MDLRSCDEGANWHPLTALIEYQGAWEDRHFYGMPWVSDPPSKDGRSVVSTIHHELTHLASARTTRLGVALTMEAARLWQAREAGEALFLSSEASALLGFYQPILEGLALFAELDFDERPDDLILSNPISLHAQMMRTVWGGPESKVFWLAREQQIIETDDLRPGLLRLLFARENALQSMHYFAGYLWIKAAAAALAKLDPGMARPTVALPFLIRLLCNHPIIEKIWSLEADENQVAAVLREAVIGLDQPTVDRVMKALADTEHLASFDLWDLHGYLGDAGKIAPENESDDTAVAFSRGREATELEFRLRASASIHFPSRTTGILKKADIEDGVLTFEVEVDDPQDEPIVSGTLLSVTRLWSMYEGSAPYEKLVERHIHKALHLEQLVWHRLQQLVGEKITIAGYWALSNPVIFGIAVWHGEKMMEMPHEPNWFEYRDLIQLTQTGLGISIEERRRFAKELEPANEAISIGRKMAARLLSDLVSDKAARRRLLQSRFLGVLQTEEERNALEAWVSCPLYRHEPWLLGEPALTRLRAWFDLPGFPKSVAFDDLLPFITPDSEWKQI